MDKMLVVTCRGCRGWYSMDYEEALDSEHYNMRTGRLCPNNNDANWQILEVPNRDDWQYVN